MLVFFKHADNIKVIYDHNAHYDHSEYETGASKAYLINNVNDLYMGNDGLYKYIDDAIPFEVSLVAIKDMFVYPNLIGELFALVHQETKDDFEHQSPTSIRHYLRNKLSENDKHLIRLIEQCGVNNNE